MTLRWIRACLRPVQKLLISWTTPPKPSDPQEPWDIQDDKLKRALMRIRVYAVQHGFRDRAVLIMDFTGSPSHRNCHIRKTAQQDILEPRIRVPTDLVCGVVCQEFFDLCRQKFPDAVDRIAVGIPLDLPTSNHAALDFIEQARLAGLPDAISMNRIPVGTPAFSVP